MRITKSIFFKTLIAALLCASGITVFAIPPSQGQLVLINGLDNLNAANANIASRSNIMVQVFDTHTPTSPCFTIPRMGYNAVAIIKWSATGIHNASSCAGTGIGNPALLKVIITPISKMVNNRITVVYDNVVDLSVPKLTAGPITLIPPTTISENMTLVINGSGTPATSGQPADATHWGFTVTPTPPVFDLTTGALIATGVPGAIGNSDLKAEKLMRRYHITPYPK